MHKVKKFLLGESLAQNYSFNEGEQNIDNLAKLNIFIGQNNSGKSRFLRLLSLKDHHLFPTDVDITKFNAIAAQLKESVLDIINTSGADDFNGLKGKLNVTNPLESIQPNQFAFNALISFLEELSSVKDVKVLSGYGDHATIKRNSLPRLNSVAETLLHATLDLLGGNKEIKYEFKRLYIPVLRGLRPLESDQVGDGFQIKNLYEQRTRKDYFLKAEDIEIFTGLDLYEHIRKLLLGNLSDRKIIADYQVFLSETFFSGQDVALIPSHNMDVLTIKIGNEKERPIHNLGDGIQSIIVQTFPLFANTNKNMLIFIEEPELYLHPGLQRKLIETFMDERFRNYQYFITTHSNHFLDLTLDESSISIYKFEKSIETEAEGSEIDAKFSIENVNNEDVSILDLLGVRNSSIFLSNCTIWVEGITDRYYIRKFFEIYQREAGVETVFKEDSHYSFVEYSGGNITHWSFLDDDEVDENGDNTFKSIAVEKICNRLFLITDKDGESKSKRQTKLSEKLGDNYLCLMCREMENILMPTVIKKVVNEYEKCKTIDDLDFKKNFNQEDYKDEYLGKFIEDNLNDKKRKSSYSAESGTVSAKLTFCKKAVSHIHSMEDISSEAKKMCERIYQFIKKNNPE